MKHEVLWRAMNDKHAEPLFAVRPYDRAAAVVPELLEIGGEVDTDHVLQGGAFHCDPQHAPYRAGCAIRSNKGAPENCWRVAGAVVDGDRPPIRPIGMGQITRAVA